MWKRKSAHTPVLEEGAVIEESFLFFFGAVV